MAGLSHQTILVLWIILFLGFIDLIQLSVAYNFYVGGKDGWVLNTTEDYSHWAERNRFQVNDTLFFKYKKGSDSVLIVDKDNYYSCNTKNPIQSLTQGDSSFKFDRSGPFFFISGNADNCNKGQKLIVVVMAVRPTPLPHPAPPPSPSPASPPTSSPPALSPGDHSPSDSDAPAPVPPSKSGSQGLTASVGLLLTGVLGSFVGIMF